MLVIKIPKSWTIPHLLTTVALLIMATNTFLPPPLAAAATADGTYSPPPALDDTLPVHKLRAAYELVQAKSWRLIEQQFASSGKLSETVKAKIVKELFVYHHNYVTTQLAVYENANKDHLQTTAFPDFNHFYEWNYVQGHINATNSLFDVFREYLAGAADAPSTEINSLSARDFAETVLYDKKWPIEESFNGIHQIMVGQGLYYKMATDSTDHICRTQRSAQQVLYQMYTAVSLTELKGYAMMQFSWMLLRTYGVGNFTKEADLMRQRYEARTNKTHVVLQKVMERADNMLYRCDPVNVHVEGETFERATKLLQGYVENEVDMNTEETCRETCDHYQYTESFTCFKELYCSKQPKCTGKVLYCQYVDSDMWICPAKPSTGRRYEYIEYESGRTLGRKKNTCTRGTTKVDSWWRYLFWHCSYCFCVCDEQGYGSDRYFSLREEVSDIAENKIVTGLRFRKVKRILHLQIQEGLLGPQGTVNASTTAWRKLPEFKITDRNVKTGVDYHTMSWKQRAIDLTMVKGQPGQVVTGVRFVALGSHLNLEVRLTEFKFETGQLVEPKTTSIWHSSYFNESQTSLEEIQMKNPDIPTEIKGRSVANRKPNQYIQFTHTGLDADAAQTTIPYLDAQDVVPVPPMPLIGVGLYHKAAPESGGFVGPRIYTYDVTAHIKVPEVEVN